jgi:hypothetical protein
MRELGEVGLRRESWGNEWVGEFAGWRPRELSIITE